MKKYIVLIISVTLCSVGWSQQASIKGQLLNTKKEFLRGVSIQLKNAKKAAITDSLGNFSLPNIAAGKQTVVFNLAGYTEKDTTLILTHGNQLSLTIQLVEASAQLEEVVIVASSRTNSRIEDLPTKVEVLGAEEVGEENQIKPGNIASLLGDIAGIQIQQTSAATGNADMRIQGLQGKYTQLLRDGMPLFGGYGGSFSILQIPPLDLQQVELVKGAASTLYGGGAIAGMVNLVSKKPKLGSPEHSITLNRSTLQENNLTSFFSDRNKKIGYTMYAGGTLQKEVDVNNDGFSDVPSVKGVFLHPRIFLYNNPSSTVILGYTLNYEDRNGGDMQVLGGTTDATHQFFIQNKTLRNTADISWEQKLPNHATLTTKATTSFLNRKVNSNVLNMEGNQLIWYSEVAYNQKIVNHNFVAGINFNGEAFTKQAPEGGNIPNNKSNTLGTFLQDDWHFAAPLTLQAGIRVDNNSQYGAFVLPRLSLLYKANSHISMRLGGGLGYKTPTLFNSEIDERDYQYLAGYAANITAEKSYGANYDINYKTKAGDWNLTFNQTFFYNQINQPLLLDSTTNTQSWVYRNLAQTLQTAGFETYVQAKQDELELYFGYVYTNAKRNYNAMNPNLPLIARNKLATVIAYEFSEQFRAGIEAAYTGQQYLDDGTTTTPYLFGALMLRYGIKNVSLVLNCENVFDYRQNKTNFSITGPKTNPTFPEIWAPLDGRVINLSMMVKW